MWLGAGDREGVPLSATVSEGRLSPTVAGPSWTTPRAAVLGSWWSMGTAMGQTSAQQPGDSGTAEPSANRGRGPREQEPPSLNPHPD